VSPSGMFMLYDMLEKLLNRVLCLEKSVQKKTAQRLFSEENIKRA
jgi:hypothetical protein